MNLQALQASETRYRRLFESARDGILIVDAATGQIIDVNPFLAKLLGYQRASFLGKHIWDLGPFRDVVSSKEAFDELQAEEYIAYEDLPLETSDGRRVDVGFVSNVYLADGKRIIQCNIRDITARKQAERDRESLAEQLSASQKMEAIGGLAGGVAHDFNNLLSVILCYTRFVLESLPPGGQLREDLLEVEKAGELGVVLTRQLLTFSRKQVVQPVLLQLDDVVVGVERMLRRILREDIDLVHTLEPGLARIVADPGQIEQVIMNLVVNARDAMPGGGRLSIETRAGVDGFVTLAITDTGCGMDAATKARLFEPFYTTKERGTGLGLSTVFAIVKQIGGTITVDSEIGRGTRFEVHLPAAPATMRARPPAREAAERSPGTGLILVVEDAEPLRNLTRRILVAAGYTVLTAANGREALAICSAHLDDLALVVTDVVMPQLGGRAFALELLRLRPGTRILFMSGYAEDAGFRLGVLAGETEFIGKPFSASDLTAKVREILDRPR